MEETGHVWLPDGAQEALRDLTRAREDIKHLQRQAKQRLLAYLGVVPSEHTGFIWAIGQAMPQTPVKA